MELRLLLVSMSIPLFVFIQSIVVCLFSCVSFTNAASSASSKKRLTLSKSTLDVNYAYEFTQLLPSGGANRTIVNNFATLDEIALIKELLEATEFMFVKGTIPGNIVYGGSTICIHNFQPKSPRVVRYYRQKDRELRKYFRNNSDSEISSSSSSEPFSSSQSLLMGMKNGYHRRYLAAMTTMLRIIERIAVYTESAFGSPVIVDEANFFIRTTNEETRIQGFQELLKINHTQWNHVPHCDSCSLDNSPAGVGCQISTVYKSNLDFSAILYMNEVEGGEFGFVELPKSTAKQRRKGAKYYSLPPSRVTTSTLGNDNNRRLRGQTIDEDVNGYSSYSFEKADQEDESSLVLDYTPHVNRSLVEVVVSPQSVQKSAFQNPAFYESFLYKHAQIKQYIQPSAGKLVVFSSGIENVHVVTEIVGQTTKRYSLNLWIRKADNKQANSMKRNSN